MREEGTYQVWAADNMVYGPVSEETLLQWVKDNRVEASTWIYDCEGRKWCRAAENEAVRPLFQPGGDVLVQDSSARSVNFLGLTHEELRQFSVFSCLSDQDLAQFLGYAEICEAHEDEVIVSKGDPGDAIFFVLRGQVRVRLMVGFEKILGRISEGEFFGEMVMFRQGTRSADVVSEGETRLLRLGLGPFRLLMSDCPSLAVPLLFGIGRAMSDRLAEDDRRFQEDVTAEFHWLRN